jgi:hypothetical protein
MPLNGTRLRFFPTADMLAPREWGRLLFFKVLIRQSYPAERLCKTDWS